jgi:hypothetical protein
MQKMEVKSIFSGEKMSFFCTYKICSCLKIESSITLKLSLKFLLNFIIESVMYALVKHDDLRNTVLDKILRVDHFISYSF